MTEVGIREAKARLSELVERVERGERLVLTRHGKPVAELGPVRQRAPGGLAGQVGMRANFDETPGWLIDAFEGGDALEAGGAGKGGGETGG